MRSKKNFFTEINSIVTAYQLGFDNGKLSRSSGADLNDNPYAEKLRLATSDAIAASYAASMDGWDDGWRERDSELKPSEYEEGSLAAEEGKRAFMDGLGLDMNPYRFMARRGGIGESKYHGWNDGWRFMNGEAPDEI